MLQNDMKVTIKINIVLPTNKVCGLSRAPSCLGKIQRRLDAPLFLFGDIYAAMPYFIAGSCTSRL